MKYLAKIKYLGTAFHGFQVQPELRTVQGELNTALNQAFGRPCKVTGCSRTDAGVHANEFCLIVECEGGTIPADKLPIAVSRFLPNDLCLFSFRALSTLSTILTLDFGFIDFFFNIIFYVSLIFYLYYFLVFKCV